MRPGELLFFLSSFLARFGDQILLFIVPLVVFQSTGSVSWAGASFFIETLPRFVAFPVCGILCDRIPPLRLLHVSQILRGAVCAGGVAGHALFGGIGWLIALSALCGIMTTQGLMAREVVLPRLFAGRSFKRTLSYTQIADQLGTVLGPVVASLLFAVLSWQQVVLCTAALFVCADVAVTVWQRTIRPPLSAKSSSPQPWSRSLGTALDHIRHRPGLIELVILAAALNLVIGVTLATSAAMVTGWHGQSDFAYAAVQVAGAVATVLILAFVAHSPIPLPRLGAASYLLVLAGGLLTAIAGTPWLYMVGYVLIVGFDKMFNIYIRSARQEIIPPEDYGKTTGVIVAVNNLSQPLAGLAVSLFSASLAGTPYVIAGCVAVMAVLGLAVAQRRQAATREAVRSGGTG